MADLIFGGQTTGQNGFDEKNTFGELDLTTITRFDEVPVGNYKSKPSSMTIKLVNGAPLVELKYVILEGQYEGKVITSKKYVYKFGTTEKNEKKIRDILVFISNAYQVTFDEAKGYFGDFQRLFKQVEGDLIIAEQEGFPQDAPIGTLEIGEFAYERDGVEAVAKTYFFKRGA